MKKAAYHVLITVSLLALILPGFTACQINLSPQQTVGGTALVLSLKDGVLGKTLVPSVSTEIASYDIRGSDVKGNAFERLGVTETTVVNSLYADTWTVVATGKNASGEEIGAGAGTVTLVKGQVVALSIDVVPQAGQEMLSITIGWPAGSITSPRIVSSLTVAGASGGDDFPFTVDSVAGTATATISREHGYYGWSLQLYDDQVRVFGLIDAVRILANFPTTATIHLTADTISGAGGVQLSVTPNMDNPIGIMLSTVMTQGQTVSVSATADQAVDRYQWYLNGSPIYGATSSSVTVGAGLGPGHYQLTLMAGKGTVLSSATTEFRVLAWQTFGAQGSGVGQFSSPDDVALDSSGRIYIADWSNSRIVRMDDMSGAGWVSYGTRGSGVGQFSYPQRMAVDAGGRIYVSDAANCRIVRMDDMSGTGWTTFGSQGTGVGQFGNPFAIAFDASGRIYVVDELNNRIVRMDDMSGTGWTTVGSQGPGVGQFNQPWGIATDSSGRIYVADTFNYRIVRMDDMSGTGWTAFGSFGSGVGQFLPTAVALDASGRIHVLDVYNYRVVRMDDMSGAGWTTFGSHGSGAGQFAYPYGTAIGADGRVYVADGSGNRIAMFGMP